MGDEDHDFAGGDAGASDTFPMQCSALRKNGFVMIKAWLLSILLKHCQSHHHTPPLYHHLRPQNRPCKIVEMSTSKTGKHGHAKVHLVALDIFTGALDDDEVINNCELCNNHKYILLNLALAFLVQAKS